MALDSNGGAKKLLMSNDSDMTLTLYRIFFNCPAMAACLTFDADCNQVIVECNPLWLELRQKQGPAQIGMHLTV